MRTRQTYTILFLLTLALLLAVSSTAQTGRDIGGTTGASAVSGIKEGRVALVIGNSAYKNAPLRNPVNDANDVAAALTECGFDVVKKTDCTYEQMDGAVTDFGRRIRSAKVALLFYAGHGMQAEGQNFLIPIDANLETASEAKFRCVNAGLVLTKMEAAGTDVNIVILDACRNNPFARTFRAETKGLAVMDAAKGSIIAYATAPGSVAADGTGRNGLFTGNLLKYLRTPSLDIRDVFMRTRIDVAKATADKQIPWENTSLMGEFYFRRGASSSTTSKPPPVDVDRLDPLAQLKKQITYDIADCKRLVAKGKPASEFVRKVASSRLTSWREAAETGMSEAQFFVGCCYYEGLDVLTDYEESVEWNGKAAKRGNPWAQNNLGVCYYLGRGVAQDHAEAARWFRKAADQGYATAQYNLGQLYRIGEGVAQDPAEAVRWYRKAAEQGCEDAQWNLGICYKEGEGVAQDPAETVRWYRKAAEQGNEGAKEALKRLEK